MHYTPIVVMNDYWSARDEKFKAPEKEAKREFLSHEQEEEV